MATIIHIGYHRTGTSFLQKSIFPQCSKHSFHGHPEMIEHNLIDIAWKADRSINYNQLQTKYSEGDYFISFESFIGPIKDGSILIDIVPWRLKKVFGDKKVKILITIRKQDEFLKSYYAQWIASGGTIKIMDWLGQKNLDKPRFDINTLDYLATYKVYAEVFGEENILVLPHELLKIKEDKFLASLNDFSDETFQAIPRTEVALNRSLSGYQLKWMRFLNKVFETQISLDYLFSKKYFNTTKYRIKLQHSNFLRFGESFSEEEKAYLKQILEQFKYSNFILNQKFDQYDLKEYGYC
ncbi:hypothetical protein [Aureispira sp. CCB-QB1]|uniref:hypothetical protein n=1 Tax=Aureispira sp. CCB-QB1 TaxID=1313421 RepID=UPI00069817D3|nr:hypothetical protein [Aureispira sp. CCB-QB1]